MLQAIIYLRQFSVNLFKRTGNIFIRIFSIIVVSHLLLIGLFGLLAFMQGIHDDRLDYAFIGMISNYFCVSILTYFAYYFDKRAARRGKWRISEKRLHYLELCGGWIGALIAQKVLHHKNRKSSFQLVYWLIAIFHLSLFLFYIPAILPFIPFAIPKILIVCLNLFLLFVISKAIDEKGKTN